MTREEAIKMLKEDGCGYCTWQSINPYECENKECKLKVALDMAIKALEQEPCDDAISRQAVLDEISDYNNDLDYTTNELYDRIERMSSVRPQEPKTGKWIRQDNTKEPLYGWYFCSECNSVIGDKPKYCPNCGARMIEPQESEDKEDD